MAIFWYTLPLLAIVYEDFRYRAIHWVWLLMLLLLIGWYTPFNGAYLLINIGLLSIQWLGLTIYFSLKEGRMTNIINNYLGIGDLLFFIPLCLLFSPINLLVFFVASLSSGLGFVGFANLINRPINQNVPLAGIMAGILILVLFVAGYFGIDLQRDLFIRSGLWSN